MDTNKIDSPQWRNICLSAAIVMVAAAVSPAQARTVMSTDADDQAIVECQLPPQLRQLGNHATYLAAGRRISTSIADCKVRGGTYDGHGPGAYAGQGSAAPGTQAVTIGGDQDRLACPKSGIVAGLKSGGGLSVRAAPGAAAGRIDKLNSGKRVFMCDWSGDGAWVGVVYAGTPAVDCGVSKTIDRPQPYAGACRSGWVSARYVRPVSR